MWPGYISFFMTTMKLTVRCMENFRLLSTITWHYTFQTSYRIMGHPMHFGASHMRMNGTLASTPTNNRSIESEILERLLQDFTFAHTELPTLPISVTYPPVLSEIIAPDDVELPFQCSYTQDGPCQCFIHSLN